MLRYYNTMYHSPWLSSQTQIIRSAYAVRKTKQQILSVLNDGKFCPPFSKSWICPWETPLSICIKSWQYLNIEEVDVIEMALCSYMFVPVVHKISQLLPQGQVSWKTYIIQWYWTLLQWKWTFLKSFWQFLNSDSSVIPYLLKYSRSKIFAEQNFRGWTQLLY